jgi:hypothetical protein
MGADRIPTTSFTFVRLLMTVDIIAVQLITNSHKPSENHGLTGFVSSLTLSLSFTGQKYFDMLRKEKNSYSEDHNNGYK